MRTAAVVLALVAAVSAGCSRARTAGPEIAAVNAVVGDASFAVAFGRAPTATDDPRLRVRTHLAFAEAQLRTAPTPALTPTQRAARARALDRLRAYWQRGELPAAEGAHGAIPAFVDARGVRCAVAYLAEADLGASAIAAIDARYHHAYIPQIDDAALAAWAVQTGFSRQELALIQPAYPPERPDVQLAIGAEYLHAVDEDPARGALSHGGALLAGVRWTATRNRWVGRPIVAVTGGVGALAGDAAHLVYRAHAHLGASIDVPGDHYRGTLGATAGFGVDGIADRSERAFTIPLDAFLYLGRPTWRLGLLGGPRFSPDDRTLGWRAAVAWIRRTGVDYVDRPERELRLELGVERMDDALFLGLRFSYERAWPAGRAHADAFDAG